MPSPSSWIWSARLACRRRVSRASAWRSTYRQPRASHAEQSRFGRRGGHACDGAHFRVRDLAAGERAGNERPRAERPGPANPLPRGAEIEPRAPAEPGRAGAETGVPALPRVELADQIEQMRGRGVEVRGQLGDLVPEAVQFGEAGMIRDARRGVGRHGETS